MLWSRSNQPERKLAGKSILPIFLLGTTFLTPVISLAKDPSNSGNRESQTAYVERPQDFSAELKQLMELILEQNRAIESLRSTVADQQAKIEKLQAGAPKVTPESPAAVEVKKAEPISSIATTSVHPGPATSEDKPKGPASLQAAPAALIEAKNKAESHSPTKKWFEKYSLRGYTQFRYNRLLETNAFLGCEQCDRSWGNNNGFFIRRARLVLSGDINDRVFMYIQPDLASSAGTSTHYGQLRDLYFDVSLDKKKEFRIRVGQSKVPFGFENLQSSQNRLSLDRSDTVNSAVANERDLGAFFYWAPEHIRKRFSHLVSSGLKGSGDYGVFGAGLYNGQTANRPEANNNLHTVARLTYPFELKNGQFIEAGISGYTGQYSVGTDQRSPSTQGPTIFPDRRVAGSFVFYPQPFGFQVEYNAGRGPMFNPETSRIENRRLQGGYGQLMYMFKFHKQILTPYVKAEYYYGGKKQELDARRYLVREQEFGVEWQPHPYLELTTAYAHSDRTYQDFRLPDNRQEGNVMRIQLQFNY